VRELRNIADNLRTAIVTMKIVEVGLPDGVTREVVRAAIHHTSLSMTVLNQEAAALERWELIEGDEPPPCRCTDIFTCITCHEAAALERWDSIEGDDG
jgi:hypothetical protein